MANYDKLNADIATLAAKVDAQNAKIVDLEAQLATPRAPAPAPVDEQPSVDAADAAVEAIAAKLP